MVLHPSFSLTISKVLLQVVHYLCRITDNIVIVDQNRNFPSRIQAHEPWLVVLAQRKAHIILLTAQTFLCYGQTYLDKIFKSFLLNKCLSRHQGQCVDKTQ